jgi:hypothetical protein
MVAPVLLALALLTASPRAGELPPSLVQARKLAQDLRFEEAVVEYHRYLGEGDRPTQERAQALLELGFLHLVLADAVSAQRRAAEALELDPSLVLPPDAPPRQVAFLEEVRRQLSNKPKVEVLPRGSQDPSSQVHARLTDLSGKVRHLMLRHALSPTGPFYGTLMRCAGEDCAGEIPSPGNVSSYTAWYFVEAVDADGNTLARAASPTAPLQLSVVQHTAWYQSPWFYAGGAAVVVGLAAVVFVSAGPVAGR